MDPRTISLCCGAIALALAGGVYGVKFLRRRNYLLGIEWLILGFSSANVLIYFLTGWESNYKLAHFFDAFSRAFGIPVVTTVGLMVITHRYRPSILQDVLWFAGSFLATFVLVTADFMKQPLPYFYVAMWILFSGYLVYFIKRLVDAGENVQALGVTLALVSSLVIACIYDFYKIPGEETNIIFNFFTLALFTWAFFAVQLHYAYCALERRVNAAASCTEDSGLRAETRPIN